MMIDSSATFDKGELARICTMREGSFEGAFDMERVQVAQRAPNDFYLYRDNGADVLAVAHLDTVGQAHERGAHYVQTEAGLVVYSRALDDRLGAYIITDMLPKMDIHCDWLFTVGEESGQSTAAFFDSPKMYDWMIEFDRGGSDVVMYQYDDIDTRQLVRDCGALPADGIFSDISHLDHLGIKGFNWGVGYRDYHGPAAHAYLEDTFEMVDHFQLFHAMNVGTRLVHHDDAPSSWASPYRMIDSGRSSWSTKDEEDDIDGLQAWYERNGTIGGYHGFNDNPDSGERCDVLDEDDPFYVADHWNSKITG